MIELTRLDGSELVLNADLVAWIEPTPDTLVTLTTGGKLVVKESVKEVTGRVVSYRQRLLSRLYLGLPPERTPANEA
ncbi:MAG: flagellar FlbD family protein [Planctomycetes bacterium]|nr:flagellar FlbD family protein [Planctomycetota bacterium]